MAKIMMNEVEKAIVEAVERHNDYCYKVGNMVFDAKVGEPRAINLDCVDSMRMGNIETGIELCCKMRELHIDACVDTIWGYVMPKGQVDIDEIREDSKPRYATFEFVE